MIKLIALDLDGTFLKSDKTPDPNTLNKLVELQDKGINYIFVTGRCYMNVKNILDTYNINPELILNSGHEYRVNRKVVHKTFIPLNILKKIITVLEKHNMSIIAYNSDNKIIFEDFDKFYYKHISASNKVRGIDLRKEINNPIFSYDLLKKSCILINHNSQKFNELEIQKIDARNADEKETINCINELNNIEGITCYSSYYSFLEITSSNSNKGEELKRITNLKGINNDEVLVFGVGANDIEMLNAFNNSYAMANADEIVFNHANYKTLSNDDGGIYHIIKNL